jgi:hypothetical protein
MTMAKPVATVKLTDSVVVYVNPPTFEEVLEAERRHKRLTVPYILLGSRAREESPITVASGESLEADVNHTQLEDICDVKYDSAKKQYSFKGRYSYSYERSSYNQSSYRTETTWYEFCVEWGNYDRDRLSVIYVNTSSSR